MLSVLISLLSGTVLLAVLIDQRCIGVRLKQAILDEELRSSTLAQPYRLPYESERDARARLKWWEERVAEVEWSLNLELRLMAAQADAARKQRDADDDDITGVHQDSLCLALREFGAQP